MKKYFLFLLISAGFSIMNFGQQTRILFLGNSYTYVNDLPGTLSQLALSLGDSIYYESNTPGGYMLIQHAADATSLQKISTPGWDYVVIQAQSEEPALDSSAFYYQTYPYARKLDSLIHVANPCAVTVFYMTWGRKYGDSYWCPVNPPMCTFNGMNQKLRDRYLEMATANFSRVAPAGVAWKNAWQADSSINLWQADNSHPSTAGTYLTANVFYASIFKQSTVGSAFTGGLTTPQAVFFQNIASNTVLDSMDTWMLQQNPIHTSFIDTIQQSSVQFYNTSYNANQFWWNFGDGIGYSILENSGYFYDSAGTYQVELIASNGCYSDTAIIPILITSVGIESNEVSDVFGIYPNPVSEGFYVEGKNLASKNYCLMDAYGRVVQTGSLVSNFINVANLAAGAYFIFIDKQAQKIYIK